MHKKITLIIEGVNGSINMLLKCYLEAYLKLTAKKYAVEFVAGFKNYKGKSGNIILFLASFDETQLLKQLKNLKTKHGDFKIILFTNFNSGDLICTLHDEGIHAHISVQDEHTEITKAIEIIVEGFSYNSHHTNKIMADYYFKAQRKTTPFLNVELTLKEKEVLKYILKGLSSSDIAEKISRSARTVETHRQHIYEKIGVHNIAELMIWVHKNNFYFDT